MWWEHSIVPVRLSATPLRSGKGCEKARPQRGICVGSYQDMLGTDGVKEFTMIGFWVSGSGSHTIQKMKGMKWHEPTSDWGAFAGAST